MKALSTRSDRFHGTRSRLTRELDDDTVVANDGTNFAVSLTHTTGHYGCGGVRSEAVGPTRTSKSVS